MPTNINSVSIEVLWIVAAALAAMVILLIALLFRVHVQRKKAAESHRKEAEQQATRHRTAIDDIQATHHDFITKYTAIIDEDAEVERLQKLQASEASAHASKMEAFQRLQSDIEGEISALRASYREKRQTYDRLRGQLAIFDEKLSFAELGVYEPYFNFDDSESFKAAIRDARAEQKGMIERKTAVFGTTSWLVDGSASKGETMTNRNVRMTLRAYNNECEAAIANTKWNNVLAMEKRVIRARNALNKLNQSSGVVISDGYEAAKLRELRLTHEYREKRKEERDKRSEKARLEREEKRLLQEAQAAVKEQEKFEELLARARAEVGVVTSEEQAAKIKELERQLEAANAKLARARSMAEQTMSGFVYIISNIGSFGEGVVKIGLTRRLDPSDRVRELGDASVPFLFDTHAMIYSDEAPRLEAALHSEFDDRRINVANSRKEFFRVSLDEVEQAVSRLAPGAEFYRDIEAQEYFETLARRRELADRLKAEEQVIFPNEL